MGTASEVSVRIEILARADCPSRGMAIAVVERVVAETGVPAEIEVIDIATIEEAYERRFLGSPTVLVDGRDVDPLSGLRTEATLACRVYRTERGLAGWPDPCWIHEALLRAVGRTTTNGTHESAARSSATSP